MFTIGNLYSIKELFRLTSYHYFSTFFYSGKHKTYLLYKLDESPQYSYCHLTLHFYSLEDKQKHILGIQKSYLDNPNKEYDLKKFIEDNKHNIIPIT